MTTFKTADLDGIPLAYAVAMAEGRAAKRHVLLDGTTVAPYQFKRHPDGPNVPLSEALCLIDLDYGGCIWHPHIAHGIGGPIMDRERIGALPRSHDEADGWSAWAPASGVASLGPTRLIAGMRAHVAHKLGETVEIPVTLE